MKDLKPCLFCGGEPISGVDFYESCGSFIKLAARIKCKNCGIGKRVIFKATDKNSDLTPFSDYTNAFEKAIESWNMRTNDE